MLMLRTIFLSLLFVVVTSCSMGKLSSQFDRAEELMLSAPDSALAILNSIDSTSIHGRASRARYSLLKVMALDKCYLDITADGLLDAAESWYSHHGTPDERLKMYFYKGCIAYDKNDRRGSAVALFQAEAYADEAEDKHAVGLMYLASAGTFGSVHNRAQEKKYTEKALDVLKQAGDPLYYEALGDLAMIYHKELQWEKADSLYQIGLKGSAGNPTMMKIYLSKYAMLKVEKRNPEPEETIRLLNRKIREFSSSLDIAEAGAYAYASELLGDVATSESLVGKLKQLGDNGTAVTWLSLIYAARKDYKSAYEYRLKSRIAEDDRINEVLEDSVTSALNEFNAGRARAERNKRMLAIAVSSLAILLLVAVLLHQLCRRRESLAERERLLLIKKHLEEDMEAYQRRLSGAEQEVNDTEDQIRHVRALYDQERLRRFRELGRVSSTIWQYDKKRIDSQAALADLKASIDYVNQVETNGAILIRHLDKELGGEISNLRRDLNLTGRPEEVLFLCCCILGLDTAVISDLFKISVDNVYKKRSRYRKKIASLDNPRYNALFGI